MILPNNITESDFLLQHNLETFMEVNEQTINETIYKLNLAGRMDIGGVREIETRFAEMCASPRLSIIIDMSNVSFISSIGIRTLLTNGKAVAKRGGKFALLNPKPLVKNVLEVSGIGQILTICDDLNQAVAYVS